MLFLLHGLFQYGMFLLNYSTKNGAFFKMKICFKRFYFDLWYTETDQLYKTFIFESYSSKLIINI